MLIALAFAHFSSELLLKEQMIIPVKKTLNNAGHIDAKLIDFSEICQKKSSEIGCFLLIVSWRSFPPKFPAKSAAFSANFDFSPAKIPRNRPIVPRILTFFPRKSREIGRFSREFAPENPAKFCFFLREISEALLYGAGVGPWSFLKKQKADITRNRVIIGIFNILFCNNYTLTDFCKV